MERNIFLCRYKRFFWFSSSLPLPGYSSMPRFINHSQEIDTSALHRLRKQENHLIVSKLFTKTNFLRKSFFSTQTYTAYGGTQSKSLTSLFSNCSSTFKSKIFSSMSIVLTLEIVTKGKQLTKRKLECWFKVLTFNQEIFFQVQP